MKRRTDLKTAEPVRVTPASTRGLYAGSELSAPATRPGADDALRHPSRIGERLHYRDGTVLVVPPTAPIGRPW